VKSVLGSPALLINLVGPYSRTHMRHAQRGARVDEPETETTSRPHFNAKKSNIRF